MIRGTSHVAGRSPAPARAAFPPLTAPAAAAPRPPRAVCRASGGRRAADDAEIAAASPSPSLPARQGSPGPRTAVPPRRCALRPARRSRAPSLEPALRLQPAAAKRPLATAWHPFSNIPAGPESSSPPAQQCHARPAPTARATRPPCLSRPPSHALRATSLPPRSSTTPGSGSCVDAGAHIGQHLGMVAFSSAALAATTSAAGARPPRVPHACGLRPSGAALTSPLCHEPRTHRRPAAARSHTHTGLLASQRHPWPPPHRLVSVMTPHSPSHHDTARPASAQPPQPPSRQAWPTPYGPPPPPAPASAASSPRSTATPPCASGGRRRRRCASSSPAARAASARRSRARRCWPAIPS